MNLDRAVFAITGICPAATILRRFGVTSGCAFR
jgi:hypothetical protein